MLKIIHGAIDANEEPLLKKVQHLKIVPEVNMLWRILLNNMLVIVYPANW